MTRDAARTLGYTVVSDDHYEKSKGSQFPPRPAKLESPTDKSRNEGLGTFDFRQFPLANRRDPDEIVILGSCDGMIDDWQKNNIVEIDIPQLRFAKGFTGRLICHRLVAPKVKCLFSRWEELDLLHAIARWNSEPRSAFGPATFLGFLGGFVNGKIFQLCACFQLFAQPGGLCSSSCPCVP